MRYFDWNKAKEICEQYKGHEVDAGMDEDWFWTASTIYDGDKRVKGDPWLGSYWATPVCRVNLNDGSWVTIQCFQTDDEYGMPDWWVE